MSGVRLAPGGPVTVVGDGTTAASRAASRWRRARWTLLVIACLALVVGVLAVSRPPTSTTPFAPDSTAQDGARALAQVLERQGVEVVPVTTVDAAVRAATAGTTLLVVPAPMLGDDQARALASVPADLVLAAPGRTLVRLATGDRASVSAIPAGGVREPECAVPAAQAAGDVELAATLVPGDGATACWPATSTTETLAALVQVTDGARTVTAVGDTAFLTNAAVTVRGNAALALGLLGGHGRLVWLVQDPFDTTTGAGTGPSPTPGVLPSWTGPVAGWAVLCLLVAAAWRARRLGPLVTEDLPVVVPAAEATRGRARLYRRARARGHAAQALRAATAHRAAVRLGVPRSADPTTVTDALARATGRPSQDVADLLYGPPPADDAALAALADRLDALESEVHRT